MLKTARVYHPSTNLDNYRPISKSLSTSHAIVNRLQYVYDNLYESNTVIFFLDFS